MNLRHRFSNKNRLWRVIKGLTPLFLILVGWGAAFGQEAIIWSDPANLSQSGSASMPQVFVDNEGTLHALWQDDFTGYTYTRWLTETTDVESASFLPSLDDVSAESVTPAQLENGYWAAPQLITPPFGAPANSFETQSNNQGISYPLYQPTLVTTASNLHALWITEENNLLYSNVPANSIATTEAWKPSQTLSPQVVEVSAAAGISNTLHITYVSNQQNAGIYYQQSLDGGLTWATPLSLYDSAYFRQIDPQVANVQIISSSNNNLFIVWDDPFLEHTYISRSVDSGQTWDPPFLIDRRVISDDPNSLGPSNIKIVANDSELHIFWLAGHHNSTCSLYHKISLDEGETWNESDQLFDTLNDCSIDYQPITYNGRLILLVTTTAESYLVSWDEGRWGNPQSQSPLSAFTHPNTFRPVTYTCKRTAEIYKNQLFVGGCAESKGQDIWITSTPIQEVLSTLTSSGSSWESESSLSDNSFVNVADLSLLPDTQNHLHALWSAEQVSGGVTSDGSRVRKIVYAFWDGSSWSKPADILSSPTGSQTQDPYAVINSEQTILVVWSNGDGIIYFSKALAAEAASYSAWSPPIALNTVPARAQSPQIVIDENENLHVVYAVPFNEGRGIYLTTSEDTGESWSEPSLILDGSDLSVVNNPSLTTGANGNFYLTALHWENASTDNTPATLYEIRSSDGGETWSSPINARDRQTQLTEVVWSRAFSSPDGALHRIWQDQRRNETELWHQQSYNYGRTWSNAIRLPTIGQPAGIAAFVIDASNTTHLLQIVLRTDEFGEEYILQHWVLQNERWFSEEALNLNMETDQVINLAASITNNQQITAAYYSGSDGQETPTKGFTSVSQTLPISGEESVLPAPVEATAQPTAAVTATPLPAITPTAQPAEEPVVLPEITVTNTSRIGSFVAGFDPVIASVLLTVSFTGSLILLLFIFRFIQSRNDKTS